ncbi:hypothetical protein BUE93_08665 [Chromobacterium amazonense]|uniref:Uncharacterized protein n=1 Tax=Chromobacterium amazonense TaxID=1382803 RepID=A0A2S9X5K8_9NEIS|nr:hypothetical protein [Chromobacterium amazonense]PRP71018.1 hypothetical protein BUE93_08665 [Chromobacterium amazonense]
MENASKKKRRIKLEKFSQRVDLRLSDPEHSLSMGCALVEWGAPPGSHPLSAGHLFTAALLGARREYSALLKNLGLRHRWYIASSCGGSMSVLDLDLKQAEAKEKKMPLTLKSLGIRSVHFEREKSNVGS